MILLTILYRNDLIDYHRPSYICPQDISKRKHNAFFSLFDEVFFYVTVIVIDCQFKESIVFVVAKVPD